MRRDFVAITTDQMHRYRSVELAVFGHLCRALKSLRVSCVSGFCMVHRTESGQAVDVHLAAAAAARYSLDSSEAQRRRVAAAPTAASPASRITSLDRRNHRRPGNKRRRPWTRVAAAAACDTSFRIATEPTNNNITQSTALITAVNCRLALLFTYVDLIHSGTYAE